MTSRHSLALRVSAAVLAVLTAVASFANANHVVRGTAVALFFAWVPGDVLLSVVRRRWWLVPGVASAGVGAAILVIASQLSLALHHQLGRTAMGCVAAGAFLLLLLPSPWPRVGRARSGEPPR